MKLFRNTNVYDRRRLLEEAAKARVKGKRRKAIKLYRWVLAVERSNAELHAKLAPLLAETGQDFDAWGSYRMAAQAALREGRDDKALGLYREATHHLPQEVQAWQGLARLLARRGEQAEALETLLEGSRQFRAQWGRPHAISLLRRARSVDPWHFETVLELATHLTRTDQLEEARLLLDGLAERATGEMLRKVRRAQLRVDRSPATLWRWLQSLVGKDETEAAPPTPVHSPDVVPLRRARS
jgi:tetratricopeptide (TPR) repeat protein